MNTHKNILGGILGSLEETDYERETTVISTVIKAASGGISEAITDLVRENIRAKPEQKPDEVGKFPATGSIEFQKQKVEIDRKKIFFQTLKENQSKVQREEEKLFEEEISDIITNLPTEQKNKLLHYQAGYKDRSIYQRAELRKKIIEEQKKTDNKEKAASIPSPAKQPSAIEGAFEGRSGTQGGGSANLSNQAVG